MLLQEAMKDKKAFKRKEWKNYAIEFSADWCPLFRGTNCYDARRLTMEDLTADDWEQEEESRTLSKSTVIRACESALLRWEKENKELDELLISELGF
jgi:hypothetical protein